MMLLALKVPYLPIDMALSYSLVEKRQGEDESAHSS